MAQFPSRTTKFKVWMHLAYIIPIPGGDFTQTVVLFSVSEREPHQWLAWYTYKETFRLDAERKELYEAADFQQAFNARRGEGVAAWDNAARLGSPGLPLAQSYETTQPMSVEEFAGAYEKPGMRIPDNVARALLHWPKQSADEHQRLLLLIERPSIGRAIPLLLRGGTGAERPDEMRSHGFVRLLMSEPFSLGQLRSVKRFQHMLIGGKIRRFV